METEKIYQFPTQVIDPEQRDFYFEHGYLVLEKFINDEWINRLNEAVQALVDRSRACTESDKVFDLEPGHTSEEPRLRRVSSPVDQHPDLWEFASNSNLTALAGDLVGPNVKFHHSKLNFKWAKGGEEVKWHQDISFWPHTNYSPLTIGMYLSDVGEEQGPLGVVPGSHNGKLYNQYGASGEWNGFIQDDEIKDEIPKAKYLTGPAGSVTIHNCRTLHGSKRNHSDFARPLLLNVFSAADAFPYTNNPISSPHDQEVVLGKAAQWAHHDNRPCQLPPDWSAGYTSIYELQQAGRGPSGQA